MDMRRKAKRESARPGAVLGVALVTLGVLGGCQAAARSPSDGMSPARAELLRGRQLLEQRQYPAAQEAFEEALAKDSHSATARAGLGLVRELAGDLDGAIRQYRRAVKEAPGRSDYAVSLGNALRKRAVASDRRDEQLEAAQRAYEHALSVEPRCVEAQIGIGLCHKARGRKEQALDAFQKAEKADPESPLPHVMMASLYQSMRENDKALEEYRAAVRLRPNDPRLHNAMAILNENIGLSGDGRARLARQRAAALYRKSLQIEPNQPQVRSRLAALDHEGDALATAGLSENE